MNSERVTKGDTLKLPKKTSEKGYESLKKQMMNVIKVNTPS